MRPVNLVSVDLETAGVLMGATPIIAIGACRALRDWAAEWDRLADLIEATKAHKGIYIEEDIFYCELVAPEGRPWSTEAEKIHGLTRERLEEHGVHPAVGLKAFAEWVFALEGPKKRYRLLSHNAAFDWAHLQAHFVHYDLVDPFDPFPSCTKNVARGVFREHGETLTGQTALRKHLDMPPHLGQHNALCDALSQAVLYQRLVAVP